MGTTTVDECLDLKRDLMSRDQEFVKAACDFGRATLDYQRLSSEHRMRKRIVHEAILREEQEVEHLFKEEVTLRWLPDEERRERENEVWKSMERVIKCSEVARLDLLVSRSDLKVAYLAQRLALTEMRCTVLTTQARRLREVEGSLRKKVELEEEQLKAAAEDAEKAEAGDAARVEAGAGAKVADEGTDGQQG